MPMYEFECEKHGRFEQYFATMIDGTEQDLARCPVCDEMCFIAISVPARRNPDYGIQR